MGKEITDHININLVMEKGKTNNEDLVAEYLGFVPGEEHRRMIIQESIDTGKPLAKVANSHGLPELFILDDDSLIEFRGEKMLPSEFQNRYPGKRFYVIGSHEDIEKHKIADPDFVDELF